jgi:hypothetical protein
MHKIYYQKIIIIQRAMRRHLAQHRSIRKLQQVLFFEQQKRKQEQSVLQQVLLLERLHYDYTVLSSLSGQLLLWHRARKQEVKLEMMEVNQVTGKKVASEGEEGEGK